MIDISHKAERSFQKEELSQGRMPHNGTKLYEEAAFKKMQRQFCSVVD